MIAISSIKPSIQPTNRHNLFIIFCAMGAAFFQPYVKCIIRLSPNGVNTVAHFWSSLCNGIQSKKFLQSAMVINPFSAKNSSKSRIVGIHVGFNVHHLFTPRASNAGRHLDTLPSLPFFGTMVYGIQFSESRNLYQNPFLSFSCVYLIICNRCKGGILYCLIKHTSSVCSVLTPNRAGGTFLSVRLSNNCLANKCLNSLIRFNVPWYNFAYFLGYIFSNSFM